MMQYKVFINSVKGIRKLVPYNDDFYQQTFDKLISNKSEAYESIYIYQEEHFNEFKKTKSLAGIKNVKTDKVVFDFDSKEDINKAFIDTKTLVSRLLSEGFKENEVSVAFSSNKGFHVVIVLNELITRKQFEEITDSYAGDLKTFDTTVSDEQRVFRLPLSFNPLSNKYKVPLAVADFMDEAATVEGILEYATSPNLVNDKEELLNASKAANKFKTVKVKKEPLIILPEVLGLLPDLSNKPDYLTPAKYVLSMGFFEKGERNEACMILASTYRYLKMDQEHAYNSIKATLRLRARRLQEEDYDRDEIWLTVIEPVYSLTWKGGLYSEETGLLKKTIERYNLKKDEESKNFLVDLNSVADYYKDFAENIDKNTIKLGIEELDNKVRITTSSLVCLLAAAGAGKSSVSFSFMNYLSKNDCKSIFFSMDMSIPQVYQRLIQKHTGHTGDKITDNYKSGNKAEIQKYTDVLSKEYKNVRFCFKSGITTELIRQMVIEERNRTGILPKLVVCDYLECIQGPFSDSNANKAIIATQLKDIANEFGLCMFLLVQPQKQAGTPADELTSYRQIKGSSVIEEQATQVLTLSRPGFSPKHPEDDNYAIINVVKNRMGELSSTDLHWAGLTGTIRSLMQEERGDLEALRNAIKMQKAEEESSGGPKFKKFGNNSNGGDMY